MLILTHFASMGYIFYIYFLSTIHIFTAVCFKFVNQLIKLDGSINKHIYYSWWTENVILKGKLLVKITFKSLILIICQ